jgi:hypothetical protein
MKDIGVVCLIMRPITFFVEEDIDKESKGKKVELTGNHRIE